MSGPIVISQRGVGTSREAWAAGVWRAALWAVLLVLAGLPLVTLYSQDEVGRWVGNHCLMASPDEPSYALAARAVAEDGGLSTMGRAGIESFYPPGVPVILGVWGKVVGPGIFSLHVCLTLCLCGSVVVAFFLVRRLLADMAGGSPRWVDGLAMLITAVYATNWYTLETGVFLFSEPAFLLVTFLWLLVGVRWADWPRVPWQTGVVVGLAVAAMAIRTAGLTCLAATVVYGGFYWMGDWRDRRASGHGPANCASPPPWHPTYGRSLAVLLLIPAVYFGVVHFVRPIDREHQATPYSEQLLRGITDAGSFPHKLHTQPLTEFPATLLQWGVHVGHLAWTHLGDWAALYMPPYRDDDFRPTLYFWLAWFLWGLCLLGLAMRLRALRRGKSSRSILPELYLFFYVGLYILWPFNMTRFWVPILPVMLCYLPLALRVLPLRAPRPGSQTGTVLLAVLLGLLVNLNAQELALKLPYYQRRLNYVSDCLADNAMVIRRASPVASQTYVMVEGGDEQFLFSWYLRFAVHAPRRGKHLEDLMVERMREHGRRPGEKLFLVSFFANDDFVGAFKNVGRDHPELLGPAVDGAPLGRGPVPGKLWQPVRLAGREIITSVWELLPPGDVAERDGQR